MRELTYVQAIREAVDEEMARDPTVFVVGEDLRVWGAPQGEFKGLFDKYGGDRILDTAISERAIMGTAIGAAITGTRPIASIMFSDFLGVCMSEILHALCKTRYMTGGMVRMPVTIMSLNGGGFSAAGEHSSCLDALLTSVTGLKIVVPSTPYDAKGLLKTSIREDNPTIFFYHKMHIYGKLKGGVPESEYTIPLGKADIKREGSDVTVVAWANMVHVALATANELQKQKGISIELIDPRTLVPLDKQAIIDSVKKTGKLVIMDEEPKIGSAAGEISAVVAEEAFDFLNAPIKRVCAPDTPVPFSPILEKAWMPDEEDLIKAVTEIM